MTKHEHSVPHVSIPDWTCEIQYWESKQVNGTSQFHPGEEHMVLFRHHFISFCCLSNEENPHENTDANKQEAWNAREVMEFVALAII